MLADRVNPNGKTPRRFHETQSCTWSRIPGVLPASLCKATERSDITAIITMKYKICEKATKGAIAAAYFESPPPTAPILVAKKPIIKTIIPCKTLIPYSGKSNINMPITKKLANKIRQDVLGMRIYFISLQAT